MERGAYCKKGDKEEPGNSLLSVVGKVFCKIRNNRLVERLERKEHCMKARLLLEKIEAAWIMFILHMRLYKGNYRKISLRTHFFDVQKAYDTVWRDDLWLKLWDMGVKEDVACSTGNV